jgi:hypothetical protein
MKKGLFFACIFWVNTAQAKTFVIDISANHASAKEKKFAGVTGGDTLLFAAGERGAIQFADFVGSPGHYITIINADSLCEIKSLLLPYGISMRNCHYVRLCGGGSKKQKYGIKIAEVSNEGAGLGISDKSDNIEICFIEISNTKGPGILCKTNPDCFTSSDNFTMLNTSIHNNYIHHTGTEGMYIGSTAYEGAKIKCDSVIVTKFPPVLDGVEVYDNEVSYTGWDGIQISDAIHVKCYHNHITFDSQKDEPWQNCGLIIGGGASGAFYENTIEQGKGFPINCFGKSDLKITSNKIIMDSSSTKTAIYINDKMADKKTSYLLKNNTIQTQHQPAIVIINKINRKQDVIKGNLVNGKNVSENVSYQGVKPAIK